MLATLDHGDTVLVPNPSYPIHIYGAVIAGAQVRSVPLVDGVDFFGELERAIRETIPRPKMMILGFPSNPTAQCVELDFFERVVALAKQYNVLVIHDLAYADIVYDGWKAPSIMQVPGAKDIAVEFFTLSKSYNMAGWRIGFMVGNPELVSALARIKSYHDYGTFTPLQVAAIAALEGDQQCVRDIAEQYRQRRNVLVKGCTRPAGWWRTRRRRCTCGRKFPSLMLTSVRWSSPNACWRRPRSASRRASASATTAIPTCASR